MSIKIPHNLAKEYPNITKNLIVKIPKIIHQTYISLEKLPEVWKDTPTSWKTYHPEWKYIFWGDIECRLLVKNNFAWFLKTYDSYKHNIQRADAIRPMILYTYGGIYADCDIQAIKPIDDLFYQDYDLYLIRTPNNDVVTNCLMASKAKIKFWIDVINEMKRRIENPSIFWSWSFHWSVMYTTGPMMLNYIFHKLKNEINYTFLPRELILPSSCSICTEKPCQSPLSYTKLLEGCSWVKFESRLYNYFICKYQQIIIILGFIFFIYTCYSYYKYK